MIAILKLPFGLIGLVWSIARMPGAIRRDREVARELNAQSNPIARNFIDKRY